MDPALEKLRAALEEYLAEGGNTPVAQEAQALMQAIDGGGDMGGGPGLDDLGGLGDMGGGAPVDTAGAAPEDQQAMMPADNGGDQMPPPGKSNTFEGARAGAKDRLKKLNKR